MFSRPIGKRYLPREIRRCTLGEQIEFYNNLYLICFVLGCVFLLLALISFFGFHICKVINDLSGRSERLAIMDIKTGKNRGKRELGKKQKIASQSGQKREIKIKNTTILNEGDSTTLKLKVQATTDKLQQDGICLTTVLNEVEDQTVVLSEKETVFEVIREIIIVHTDEVIEQ